MANNREVLIGAGRWKITNFRRKSGCKCMCCGRPIVNVLELTNEDHEGKCQSDPSWAWPAAIDIGTVCGPRVFSESTVGFYDNPHQEWNRQWHLWKDFVNTMIFFDLHRQQWDERVPPELGKRVEGFITGGFLAGSANGDWWRVVYSVKGYMNTITPFKNKWTKTVTPPNPRYVDHNSNNLLYTLAKAGLIAQGEWVYTRDSGFQRQIATAS